MARGIAWVFPGQGAQTLGMGRELAERSPAAARAFDEASDAIGIDIRAISWEGPQEQLDRTANAQPALLAASIAALRAAQDIGGPLADPVCVAGHSLGEFTALVAAGALTLGDAARLVRRRGELMQAADVGGGMAAALGLDADAVERAIAGTGVVVANDNAPGQVVISGPRDALEAATASLKKAGAKRVIALRVSGAFHSPAMRAIVPDLSLALQRATWGDARWKLIANVDAAPHAGRRDFAPLLERQVHAPVRWVSSVRRAEGEGATTFVEFGPGNVLTGLIKRILPGTTTANVSDPKTLEEALTVLR